MIVIMQWFFLVIQHNVAQNSPQTYSKHCQQQTAKQISCFPCFTKVNSTLLKAPASEEKNNLIALAC